MQSISKPTTNNEAFETTDGTADAVLPNVKKLAIEIADMSFDEFERCAELLGELAEARTLAQAIEIETEYFQCTQRALARHAQCLGDLYAAIGRDMAKPLTAGQWSAAT